MPLFIPSFSLAPVDYIETSTTGSATRVLSEFRFMRIFMFGGGGSGGGGMSRASTTVSKYGGGGGGAGQYLDLLFPCAEFGSGSQTISYTIPNSVVGGIAGAPLVVATGYGGDGNAGVDSVVTIGSLTLRARGGSAGEGGTTFNGLGGQGNNSSGGGNSSTGQQAQRGGSGYAGSGGGAGGVNTDSDASKTGGDGGSGGWPNTSSVALGGDGKITVNGGAGIAGYNGTASTTRPYIIGGGGGSGGGATRASGLNGGVGGAGGANGGGGGGGGASGHATVVGLGGVGGAGGKGAIKILFYR